MVTGAAAAGLAWLLGGAPAAGAVALLGSDFLGARIYDVDPATGTATNGRPTGINGLDDIEYDAARGVLWGLSQTGSSPVENALFSIDISTGAATLIGATGLSIIEGDLALNPVTGVLYGVQQVGASVLQLFTVDLDTGAGTIVGAVAGGADLSALSFDTAGNLFVLDTGTDRLLRVDDTTGAVLDSVALSLPLGTRAGMDVDPETGVMYVADGGTAGTDSLYTLDTTTGALALAGATGVSGGLAGLTAVAGAPTTLVLLPLALALVAGFGAPRRSHA
jgi:DNA-binding beta-propeller fold protein YncE